MNAFYGAEKSVVIPYKADHIWDKTSVYFGASLSALNHLATKKGYVLLGCTSAGNDAFFVHQDYASEFTLPANVGEAYEEAKFCYSNAEDILHCKPRLSSLERLEQVKDRILLDLEDSSEKTIAEIYGL